MVDSIFHDSITNSIKSILERLENINENELKIINKFYNFDDFNAMFESKLNQQDYDVIMTDYELDVELLNKKIDDIKEIILNYQKDIEMYWGEYNKSYKNHLNIKLKTILEELNKYNLNSFNTDDHQLFLNKYFEFYKTVININTDKDLLESFASGLHPFSLLFKS